MQIPHYNIARKDIVILQQWLRYYYQIYEVD